MVNNFTPLDIDKLRARRNDFNTILLLIVTLTMAVLAVILFILIKKKIDEQKTMIFEPTPTIEIKPTETPIIQFSPTISQDEFNATSEPSLTPFLSITPTLSIMPDSLTIPATESAVDNQ